MKSAKFLLINILPILIILSIIYTASSQSSEEQDISPLLDRVGGEDSLRGTLSALRDRLAESADRGIELAAAHPFLSLAGFVIISIILSVLFFRFYRSSTSLLKKTLLAAATAAASILFLSVVLFVARPETIVEVLRQFASFDHIRALLTRIDFTYAGTEINLQRMGSDGLIEFFLRKGAHFFLFALLGFFLYLAFIKITARTFLSFVLAMIFVIMYAALDEYRQTFLPSRSGIFADVLLDTAGGFFGAVSGWLKKGISKKLK
ncbi:VanZ family protein [Alkalicoccus halolimnae]|uniref:VanZ family protein n=1 Tax=Alkalicoccus halolimnae TaxID=1667239 RepID=A0A5C7FHL5_9BACI|nr:VanZ family protein [Alkalicoccus halolimnae]TXF86797.1 VanZ family protein [Alkalicoccus halolimnae]